MKKIVILGIATVLLLVLAAVPAMADRPPVGAHYTFNCVTKVDPILGPGPNEILVLLNGAGMLRAVEGSPFMITDNDMTDDGQAEVQIPAGSYEGWDQARGKPGGELTFGDHHVRETGKPEWELHASYTMPAAAGNWAFINQGVTCYSYRLYLVE